MDGQYTIYRGQSSQQSSMMIQNSCPRPFVRGQRELPKSQPRIMFNDDASTNISMDNYNQQAHQTMQDIHQPTSTVHKSLVGSRQFGPTPSQTITSSGPAYSRLISPTVSRSSNISSSPQFLQYPSSGHGEFIQSPPGHSAAEHLISPANAPAPAYQTTNVNYNASQQEVGRQADSLQQVGPKVGSISETKKGPSMSSQGSQTQEDHAPNHVTIIDPRQAEQNYRQLLARISPQSPNLLGNVTLPDDKREDYIRDKQLEQMSIAYQTYRTLPIVGPKPKARHDLAMGSYMRLNQDPTWDLLEKSSSRREDPALKFQQAISSLSPQQRSQRKQANQKQFDYLQQYSLPVSSNQNQYQEQQQHCFNRNAAQSGVNSPARPTNQAHLVQDDVPAFDYKQYIESTRRAH